MQGQPLESTHVRKDIQGLRALAVLSVVIFHIAPDKLTGGFVGVDIFFVISGYLIIGQIWKNLSKGAFNFKDFYTKRFKRLLPAYLFVIICSCIIAFFLLLPSDYKRFSLSLFSSLSYFSNFWFYSQSGYFDDSLQSAPLLHTWSLSVEEQFYFIAPLLLFSLYKKVKINTLLFTLIIISFISFGVSELLLSYNQPLSFFSSPTRFWQFLTGGLLAIYSSKPPKRTIAIILSLAGFIILIGTIFYFDESSPFPGVMAVPVTFATALIIYARLEVGPIGFLMTNPISQFFGNISYSLYLWHWPIIVFYKYYALQKLILDDYNKIDKLIIIAISIILATLTYYFIENPTRRIKINTKSFKPIFISLAISASSMLMIKLSEPPQERGFTAQQLHYESYIGYRNQLSRAKYCFPTSKRNSFSYYIKEKCISTDEEKFNILLIGDSHAEHWYSALKSNLKENQTLSQATASGCRPILPYKGADRCTDMLKWVLSELLKEQKFDRIILSSRWQAGDQLLIKNIISELDQYSSELVILGPVVEYKYSLPWLLSSFNEANQRMKFAIYNTRKNVDMELKTLVEQQGGKYYSVIDAMCEEKKHCYQTTTENIPIQFDYGHLTHEGATFLLRRLGII